MQIYQNERAIIFPFYINCKFQSHIYNLWFLKIGIDHLILTRQTPRILKKGLEPVTDCQIRQFDFICALVKWSNVESPIQCWLIL